MSREKHKGMPCPLCSGVTGVSDSRARGTGISRRRHCIVCGHRFSTVEVPTGLLGQKGGVPVTIKDVDTLLASITKTYEQTMREVVVLRARLSS